MIRPATPADTPALLAFLGQHAANSMFPMTNLLGHGLPSEHWLIETAGQISGYIGLTEDGRLLPQAPDANWMQIAELLKSRHIAGLVGPAAQCNALLPALNLADAPTRMNAIEPGFSLDLADLILPDCAGYRLAPIRDSDLPLIFGWRADNLVETMGFSRASAPAIARDQVLRWQQDHCHRILWHGTTPTALAGVNAHIPQIIQIGGVYTPPALRNQGHARRATAMLLAEARKAGVKRAVLFAASDRAARAYTAIGFRPSHAFALILFTQPQQVAP